MKSRVMFFVENMSVLWIQFRSVMMKEEKI